MKSMTLTAAAFAFGAAAALLATPTSANEATQVGGAGTTEARTGWLPVTRGAKAGCGVATWLNWVGLEDRLCGVAGIAERAARVVISQDASPAPGVAALMRTGATPAQQL